MDSLLLQIIASRAGGGSSPAFAEMFARLSGSSGSGAAPDPQQLLAQLSNSNPLLAALGKQFAGPLNEGSSNTSAPVIDGIQVDRGSAAEESEAQEEELVQLVNELRDDVRILSAELRVLKERNDVLAATLGACCLCWGQDPECRFCRGRGRPGFTTPDESRIGEFVIPAIQMLRAQRARNSTCLPSVGTGTKGTNGRSKK